WRSERSSVGRGASSRARLEISYTKTRARPSTATVTPATDQRQMVRHLACDDDTLSSARAIDPYLIHGFSLARRLREAAGALRTHRKYESVIAFRQTLVGVEDAIISERRPGRRERRCRRGRCFGRRRREIRVQRLEPCR